MYLTPARFREMGFGVDISELDDKALLSLVNQASAVVDSYCNVPRIPQMHDFRGGSITREQHNWRVPTHNLDIGQRRYYPYHWPIVSVEQFRIYVTNTQYVEIDPANLVINNTERYLEVVSLALTSVGIFNALVIPNVGLATPIATCSYTYGWDMEANDEYLSNSDGWTWRAQNQFWYTDVDRAPVIKRNGLVQTETTDYTVDAIEGTVTFTTPVIDADDTVSASYHHKLPRDLQWGTAHIVAYLHGEAHLQSTGLNQLTRLRVAEVDMERDLRRGNPTGLAELLDIIVPIASELLGGYMADNLTVR